MSEEIKRQYLELLSKNSRKEPVAIDSTFDRFSDIDLYGSLEEEASSLWDNLGGIGEYFGKGIASGVTLGASEFVPGMDITWDEMDSGEKAGYIAGEGLSMLIPFMAAGRGLRALSTLAKGGKVRAVKDTVKMVDSAFLKGNSEQIARTVNRAAKKQGIKHGEVMSGLSSKVQQKLKKDLLEKPYSQALFDQAAKGVAKENGRKVLQERTAASVKQAVNDMGMRIGKSEADKMAKIFTENLSKGITHNDSADMIAKIIGGADPGVFKSIFSKYAGNAANTSAIMIGHNLIRDAIVARARGTEYSPGASVVGGAQMGLIFPALQAIPNIAFGAKGTGTLFKQSTDQQFWLQGVPLMLRNLNKTNYENIYKTHGIKPLRGLLKMMTEGGKFNVHNTSRLGSSTYKLKSGKIVNSPYQIKLAADTMSKDDVIGLLNTYRREISASAKKQWFKDYAYDFLGSMPRMAVGIATMGSELVSGWTEGNLSGEELAAHLMSSAFMTKSQGAWASKGRYNYLMDFSPHQKAMDRMDLNGDALHEIFNFRREGVEDLIADSFYDGEVVKQIEDVFDSYDVKGATKDPDINAYDVTQHSIIDKFQKIYNEIQGHKKGINYLSDNIVDIKNKNFNKADLDGMTVALKNIKFEDGLSVADMTLDRFRARIFKNSSDSIKKAYTDDLFMALKNIGLDITPVGDRGGVKFQVAPVIGKDMGVLSDYMNLINRFSTEKGQLGLVEILNNRRQNYNDFSETQKSQIKDLFDTHISELNKVFNLNGVNYDIHDNPYVTLMKQGNEAESVERLYSVLDGTSKETSDQNLTANIVQLFGRGKGAGGGFLQNIDSYKFDYKNVDKKSEQEAKEAFPEAELKEKLRPILELARLEHTDPVDPDRAMIPIDVGLANTVINNFENIKSFLPSRYREDFNTLGVSRIRADYWANEGIDARVVSSMKALQDSGLGDYKNGKMEVPNREAIMYMGKEMVDSKVISQNELVRIANRADEVYKKIGSERLYQYKVALLPGEEVRGFKSPDIRDFNTIWSLFKQDDLNKFIENSDTIISQLQNIDSVNQDNVNFILDRLMGIASGNINNTDVIDALTVVRDRVNKAIKSEQYTKDYKKLLTEIDSIRKKLATLNVPEIDGYINEKSGDLKSMSDLINDIFGREQKIKNDAAKEIFNLIALRKSNDLSAEEVLMIKDRAEQNIRAILKMQVDESIPLEELISEINSTRDWASFKDVIKNIHESIEVNLAAKDRAEFLRTDSDAFSNLAHNKDIHFSSDTFQSIAGRYNLLDVDGRNIDPGIVDYIAKNKNRKTILSGLKTQVRNRLKELKLSRTEMIDKMADWERSAPLFLNTMLRKKPKHTLRLIAHGKKLIVESDSHKISSDDIVSQWFDDKGFDVSYVQNTMLKVNAKNKVVTDSVENFSGEDGADAINQLINKDIAFVPKTGIELFSKYADGSIADKDLKVLIDKYKSEIIPNGEDANYIRLTPGNAVLFHGTPENKAKLFKSFKKFYNDNSKKGFDDITIKDKDGHKRDISGELLKKQFETTFEDIYDKDITSKKEDELKIITLFASEKPREFAKWLAAKHIGDSDVMRLTEANMVKRDWLVDGGTTIRPHKTIIKALGKSYHDPDVQAFANELVNNNFEMDVTVFADEADGAGTNIVERFQEQINDRKHVTGDAKANKLSKFVAKQQLDDISPQNIKRELPSLRNASTDGIKYASHALAKFNMALKGGDLDKIGGFKTVLAQLGENSLLGKGYLVYDPLIANKMAPGVHIALGESAAKTFGFNTNALNVPGKNWFDALPNATSDNNVKFSIENMGIGFYAKPTKGVSLSNSMTHLESHKYTQDFIKIAGIDKAISIVDATNRTRVDSENELLSYLNQKNKDEGFTQKLGLTSELIEDGMNINNIAIKSDIDRALRNEYFTALSGLSTRHGRDYTIVPDAGSDLIMPEIVNLKSKVLGKEETVWRASKTFGEIAPDADGMSETLDNINNTAFIVRYKGLDFTSYINDIFQPLVEKTSKNKDWDLGEAGKDVDISWTRDKKALYNHVQNIMKPIYAEFKKMDTNGNKLSMHDMYRMLEGQEVRMNGKRLKLTRSSLKAVKDHNIALGASGLAIPLKIHDKAVHRIAKVHNNTGLVRINHYDERVVHQRDNDGDHFYTHFQLTPNMLKAHSDEMTINKDFRMYEKELPDINLFGIDYDNVSSSKVNVDPGAVGVSKYLGHLDNQKRTIGITIGDRQAYDILNKLNLTFKKGVMDKDEDLFIKNIISDNIDNMTDAKGKIVVREGEMGQNGTDIHGGTSQQYKSPDIKAIKRLDERPKGSDFKYANGDKVEKLDNPLFNIDPNSMIERDMADHLIMSLKKINVINSDVYDQGTKRTPEPNEIQDAYFNLRRLFEDPTQFIIDGLINRYSQLDGKNKKAAFNELIRYFYKEENWSINEQLSLGKFKKELLKGSEAFQVLPHKKLRFEGFSIDAKLDYVSKEKKIKDMFYRMPQGKILYDVVRKNIFKEKDSNFAEADYKYHNKVGSVARQALNNINYLKAIGTSVDEIVRDYKFLDFEGNTISYENVDPVKIKEGVTMGAIRSSYHRLYSRLSRNLEYYSDSNFHTSMDKVNMRDIQHQMKNIESALDIMDKQWANKVIAEGAQSANVVDKFKTGWHKPKDKVFVLSFKGSKDKINKFQEKKEGDVSLSDFHQVGWIDPKGKRNGYKRIKGFTYIEVKNPMMHESVSATDGMYAKHLSDMSARLEIERVGSDADQLDFLSSVRFTRNIVRDGFSRAIRDTRGELSLKDQIWALTDARERFHIGDYFKKNLYSNPKDIQASDLLLDVKSERDGYKFLAQYLIKPDALMSKYVSTTVDNKNVQLPAYKINKRLVKSTFKWLNENGMRDITKEIVQEWEGRVNGTISESYDFTSRYFDNRSPGFNYDSFGKGANLIKSISGSGFASPFYKFHIQNRPYNINKKEVGKTFDGSKQYRATFKRREREDC